MSLERQPMNWDIITQIENELMAPVPSYKHVRIEKIEPPYTAIARRPRRVAHKAGAKKPEAVLSA